MLTWLKPASDAAHPMADPRSARQVLVSLPHGSPATALEILSRHLDSVREAEGLTAARAFEIIDEIDRAAKVFQKPLTREFLDAPPQNPAAATRIAHITGTYWHCLARAYRMMLEMYETGDPTAQALKPRLALIAARALRAFNLQLKWQLLRYAPLEPALWGSLARVYEVAERNGVAGADVEIYAGPWGVSTVRREMLKAMMLAVSSTDALKKPQIEVVERLCAQYSEFFELRAEPAPGVHFRFDLDADQAPARASTRGGTGRTVRYFGPSGAASHLRELAQEIRKSGVVPIEVNLGGVYPARDVVFVLEHLAHYWSPIPPARREKRRGTEERVEVVHGFDNLIAAIDADEFGWDFDVSRLEDWHLEDESPAGFGALVPAGRSDWISPGELVGLRYLDEGVAWAVGVVRRVNLLDRTRRRVGLELLSRGGNRVVLNELLSDGSPDPSPTASVDALLLHSPADNTIGRLTVQIALKPSRFDLRDSYGLMLYGMDYLLVPKGIVESGEDYVIAEYRVLVRSSD
ncbi:MAG: hypothetical protein GC151_02650 [Betaproteobacteria bacterium]|nr:hypothetical protein [Betaproteobacteria bacterium]